MSSARRQVRQALRHTGVTWHPEVQDGRGARGRRHPLHGLLNLMVAGFACGMKVLRRMEDLAQDLGARARRALEVPARVSDSTLWRLLAVMDGAGLRATLQGHLKRLLSSGRLQKVGLPVGVLSVDGKTLFASRTRQVEGVPCIANDGDGAPLCQLGAVRAALTSLVACPVVDMEFITGKDGESPAFRKLLPRAVEAFGGHFDVVTGDAGFTSVDNAALVRRLKRHYLWALKGNQPTLHGYVQSVMARKECAPRAVTRDVAHGYTVVRELWTHALKPGEVDFPEAHFLLCVVQTYLAEDGTPVGGEVRYFVTSLTTATLNFHQLLRLVRLHWAIENRYHWTLDAILEEDDRQPCSATRGALETVAWLRSLAYNVLAIWRSGLPLKDKRLVSWARACEMLRDCLVSGRREALQLALA
jgi:DDE_Tnp_1-associated/Transposase DDE domain